MIVQIENRQQVDILRSLHKHTLVDLWMRASYCRSCSLLGLQSLSTSSTEKLECIVSGLWYSMEVQESKTAKEWHRVSWESRFLEHVCESPIAEHVHEPNTSLQCMNEIRSMRWSIPDHGGINSVVVLIEFGHQHGQLTRHSSKVFHLLHLVGYITLRLRIHVARDKVHWYLMRIRPVQKVSDVWWAAASHWATNLERR